jgi:ABC-2 type transport system permease protein
MLPDLGKSLVRTSSFMGKELREVMRRPGVVASLILGPLLIMLLFGLGYTGYREPFTTEIVVPETSALSAEREFYEELAPGSLDVVRVSRNRAETAQRLRDRQIDLMVVAPADATQELRAGRQTTIQFAWNVLDPTDDALAHLAVSSLISELNAEIIRQAAAEGISLAEGELGPRVEDISPEVIAKPTTASVENIAPTQPDVVNYFSPAVLALVLQHLAVTLAALSMVRERLSGQMDLFRVAPVNSTEVLVGKYIAYAILSLALSGALAVLLVAVFDVPLLGGAAPVAGIVLLLTFASLGVGLLISLVADSERQAVQLSMLVLLASVFFSGFMLPVEDFVDWIQAVSYALPVTHGIVALQESMLRGGVSSMWMIGALAGLGVLLYLVSLIRLRQVLRPVR